MPKPGTDVDVVLDYLWGPPTAQVLKAIVPARSHDYRQLTWIQIGSVAGTDCPLPSAALRATRLHIVGSGQGSVSARAIPEDLPSLITAISAAAFEVGARSIPLAEAEYAWTAPVVGHERLVFVS